MSDQYKKPKLTKKQQEQQMKLLLRVTEALANLSPGQLAPEAGGGNEFLRIPASISQIKEAMKNPQDFKPDQASPSLLIGIIKQIANNGIKFDPKNEGHQYSQEQLFYFCQQYLVPRDELKQTDEKAQVITQDTIDASFPAVEMLTRQKIKDAIKTKKVTKPDPTMKLEIAVNPVLSQYADTDARHGTVKREYEKMRGGVKNIFMPEAKARAAQVDMLQAVINAISNPKLRADEKMAVLSYVLFALENQLSDIDNKQNKNSDLKKLVNSIKDKLHETGVPHRGIEKDRAIFLKLLQKNGALSGLMQIPECKRLYTIANMDSRRVALQEPKTGGGDGFTVAPQRALASSQANKQNRQHLAGLKDLYSVKEILKQQYAVKGRRSIMPSSKREQQLEFLWELLENATKQPINKGVNGVSPLAGSGELSFTKDGEEIALEKLKVLKGGIELLRDQLSKKQKNGKLARLLDDVEKSIPGYKDLPMEKSRDALLKFADQKQSEGINFGKFIKKWIDTWKSQKGYTSTADVLVPVDSKLAAPQPMIPAANLDRDRLKKTKYKADGQPPRALSELEQKLARRKENSEPKPEPKPRRT